MKDKSPLVATSLVCLLFAPVLWAGPAPQAEARFEEEIVVTEVLLDVLVTDGSGQVVAGLGKDDFIVREGKNEMELTGVDYYSTRYGAEPGIVGIAEEIPASRYFIFFFHDQGNTGPSASVLISRQLDAARKSKQWLDEEMLPSDWIAVVSYDVKLKIHQDFTQDREALKAAIGEASTSANPETMSRRDRRALPPDIPSLLNHLPDDWELRRQTTRIYKAMQLLAEATGHIVGRKNLLLFSIGFGDLNLSPGTSRPDQRFYPQMYAAFNDNNVAIYPVDLTPSGVKHMQSDFLATLADDTGGYFHRNFVNFIVPLREIGAESTGYYLLSYRSEHPAGTDGFQKVKVKTRERKLKVRARQGYSYGEPPGR